MWLLLLFCFSSICCEHQKMFPEKPHLSCFAQFTDGLKPKPTKIRNKLCDIRNVQQLEQADFCTHLRLFTDDVEVMRHPKLYEV
ncbi:hypothetical protein Aduo_011315 [Ancylostoma duodenale]